MKAHTLHETATQLESFVVKQLLISSGAFKGNSSIAGSTLTSELFADTLAQAIAKAGGLGLAPLLERSLNATGPSLAPSTGALANITSGFGERKDPFTGEPSTHTGVDLGAPEGTPIPAALAGVVIAAGPRGGYGIAVEVGHADGSSTLYAHASEVLVAPGDRVAVRPNPRPGRPNRSDRLGLTCIWR